MGDACHHQAKRLLVGLIAIDDADLAAVVHDHDTVGQPEDLFQFDRHQQDRTPGVTQRDQLFVDELDCTDIDPAGRLTDHQHRLVGLVSYRALLRLMARGKMVDGGRHIAVSEVMRQDPVTVDPEASTLQAIELMREHRVGCLPVVRDERLVGMVTERDFMNVSAQLLEQKLKE